MRIAICSFLLCIISYSYGQDSPANHDMNMPRMAGAAEPAEMGMEAHSLIESVEEHAISGTDVEPSSTPNEMLMRRMGDWTLMLHGSLFLTDIQQTGPRGADKFFSGDWLMGMAQRRIRKTGSLTLRAMLSLDPATVTERRYPELFQQGETAFGKPIVDGQHPHNLFMELAAIYDYRVTENTVLSFYAAPVGDPVLGPPAYAHRASASEDPIAPLGHHLEDSTHISDDVVTVGLTHGMFRVEASGFHGQEPDEYRWDIDSGGIDSWAARVTANPGENWSLQYSIGDLTSLEALFPHEDIRRMTASVIYNRPLREGNWDSMLLWGRNQSLQDGNVGNGYLLESKLHFHARNNVWTRIENVDRTNELLLGEKFLPAGFVERYFTRVQAYTAGYDREIALWAHVSTALGAQLTWYGVPTVLQSTYGSHPLGVVMFVRMRAR